MNKIEKLISELCPDGVEYKELDKIYKFQYGMGNTIPTIWGKYPVYGSNWIVGTHNEFNSEDSPVIGHIWAYAWIVNWWKWKHFVTYNWVICKLIDSSINSQYAYYQLLKQDFNSLTKNSSHPFISYSALNKFQIPIPPIKIQEEIVKVLDNFTLLEIELKKELKARKKQYDYYENQLLFNNNYKLNKISDFCTVNQGLQVPISERKKNFGENRYFYITIQFLKNNNKDKYYIENPNKNVICKADDILVTRTGSTGKIITGVEGCFHNNFFKVNCFNTINKRYMYYILKSKKINNKLLELASGWTVPDLPHWKFFQVEIPIPVKNWKPDLDKQKEIVEVLDKFDKLVNNISEGLPAEIEARRQQYEYYRGKLLDFKELKK